STGLTPAATTRMAIWPAAGSGAGRSISSCCSGPPKSLKTTTLDMVTSALLLSVGNQAWRIEGSGRGTRGSCSKGPASGRALLAAGSGLRGFVLTGSLSSVGLFLGGVGAVDGVLRRAVDGVEHKGFVAGVTEVVSGARGYRALVAGLHHVGVALQVGFAGAGDEGEDLVGVRSEEHTSELQSRF